MKSPISRHEIQSWSHGMCFLIHDALIPFFFMGIIYQLCRGKYHRQIGQIMIYLVLPGLWLSGLLLSTRTIDNRQIFLTYGSSFLTISLDSARHGGIYPHDTRWLHRINICQYLLLLPRIDPDFMSILWHVPLIHLFELPFSKSLLYLGTLGTIFSWTQDVYWFRENPIPPMIRYILHQTPILILFL